MLTILFWIVGIAYCGFAAFLVWEAICLPGADANYDIGLAIPLGALGLIACLIAFRCCTRCARIKPKREMRLYERQWRIVCFLLGYVLVLCALTVAWSVAHAVRLGIAYDGYRQTGWIMAGVMAIAGIGFLCFAIKRFKTEEK
ncbi:MAG: hypothetical protein NTZ65_00235 [Candidatus Berkelbacteria bacterium]|nr:hypothetical protein [Candidatus Berkelbacteria bacterium]